MGRVQEGVGRVRYLQAGEGKHGRFHAHVLQVEEVDLRRLDHIGVDHHLLI